ncbi:LacI family DNA-binding transcriptional regulator [Bacillus cihuensis]|uniref:LacI family DNA-binding transcriptional regulator n=1 Tax=Bacillus cihuensis TaxID=1208599 RepID=UPI00042843B4|nr:LacI family DNA-binding transcriptional regulator [Bacillus cihuensis]
MKIKATIKEVAKLAQVSTATVSNVINNTKYVSDEIKKQVYDAMSELNYVPNTLAKSLRVRESRLIGVMISDISNPFFSLVVRGIEDGLAQAGYNALLCNTDSNINKEREYLKVLQGKRIDGIFVSSSGNSEEYFKEMWQIDIPLVFLNRCPEPLISDSVSTNNFEGALLATEHLIKHNYRKIGIITGPQNISTGRDRFNGFKQAIKLHDHTLYDHFIKHGDFTIESGYDLMKELLSDSCRPEAVLISNNQMTLGAYNYIQERGICIPEDLAIIGFDDPEWAAIANPPLTAVRQPAYEQGFEAAQLMIKKLNNTVDGKPQEIYFSPSLMIRKSCGCR